MLFPSDNEHFNSIKVRLKPGRFLLPFAALSNFNSIKVRLKRNIEGTEYKIKEVFQFHKGTIKTYPRFCLCQPSHNFNSIKVRLKPAVANLQREFNAFQFHKGTIKTHCLGICNILIFNRICECKVNKSYWKNVDG